MAELTFKSPNFYDTEVDLSSPVTVSPSGVPAGVIGLAKKGPAFVPVTVGNFNQFVEKFGSLSPEMYGTYAANEFLKNRNALTYLRVLGAGSNSTDEEIELTRTTGAVKNAGFKLTPQVSDAFSKHNSTVQFLVAQHDVVSSNEVYFPMFSENDSVSNPVEANLVRAVFMTPETARIMVMAPGDSFADNLDDEAAASNSKFKVIVSSSLGTAFSTFDGNSGVKVFEVSLDPDSDDYFSKVMNTDPDKFVEHQHCLYADFPVDAQVAKLASTGIVGVLSGSTGDNRTKYGSYDTRFTTPSTPWFVSQPFGSSEYNLFKVESLDDGSYANKLYKVSISNLKASVNGKDPFGTFSLLIRDWNDTDTNPVILESFYECSLNPNSPNYIAKKVGDKKVFFDFDATSDDEKRLSVSGKYNNNSKFVRVVMHENVENEIIPMNSLPFGFRGHMTLKTNDGLVDDDTSTNKIDGDISTTALKGAILPPVPFRLKITRGNAPSTISWTGQSSDKEIVSQQYFWGVKFERNTNPLNANLELKKNNLLSSLTKFFGRVQLDTIAKDSDADTLSNNKFSLAKVALGLDYSALSTVRSSSVTDVLRDAAYIRNGKLHSSRYTVEDSSFANGRITFATLLTELEAAEFNKFSSFMKFTTFMQGGWDGVNIFDRNARLINDFSSDFDGAANASYKAPGFTVSDSPSGYEDTNASVKSLMTAVDIMTNKYNVNINILSLPGIKGDFVTDYTMNKVKEYGFAYYAMDIPSYSDSGTRLYDHSSERENVRETIKSFDARVIDNSYTGTYFPSVFIDDSVNRKRVKVPASVAALGALSFNDRVSFPWFAPAGFNRAALDFVNNTSVRLNVSDRDDLYESRINPIASFPRLGFVIYGQKTLQVNKSALDRINVRRLILEVKRIVSGVAQKLVFEQNTPVVRNNFVSEVSQQLSLIQAASGVEAFQVVMNETNNTPEDVEQNRLNGRVVVVPTRVVEFIALDFIVTSSGIEFV